MSKPKKTTGYTIMYEDNDSRSGGLIPLRDAGEILLFDSANDAFKYYVNEHYHDSSHFYVVEFLDYKLEVAV